MPCLLRYLQLLINSDLLFSRLFPLYELILRFSFRHKQHFLLLELCGKHSLMMLQVTFGIKFFLLISHYPFDSSVICVIFMGKGFGAGVESIFEQLLCNSTVNFVIVLGLGSSEFFPGKLYLATNIFHLQNNTSYFCSCTHL